MEYKTHRPYFPLLLYLVKFLAAGCLFVLGWRLVLSLLLLDVNTKFAAARSGEQSQLAVAERKLKYCVAALPLEEKKRQSFTRSTQISRKKNLFF